MKRRMTPNRQDSERLGNNLANHMAYIYMLTLYDKFGFSWKKCCNFYTRVKDIRCRMFDHEEKLSAGHLIQYCERKKIPAREFVNSIPFSHKMYLSDVTKKNCRAVVGMEQDIIGAFYATLVLSIPVLKETYKFSNKKIEEFFEYVRAYIEMYWKRQPGSKEHYLNDQIIRQIFIDECGYDMELGCEVKKGA